MAAAGAVQAPLLLLLGLLLGLQVQQAQQV
jgi:hypothetical protein